MMKRLDFKVYLAFFSFGMFAFLQAHSTPLAIPLNDTHDANPSHHLASPEKETQENEFIRRYYASIIIGITEDELNQFWGKNKVKEFNGIAKRISEFTGDSIVREKSRMLDIVNVEASCEKITELDQGWSLISSKKKVKFKVENTCSQNAKGFERVVQIGYSISKMSWEILSIQDNK